MSPQRFFRVADILSVTKDPVIGAYMNHPLPKQKAEGKPPANARRPSAAAEML
jgi:hypothetical protein